MRVAFIGDIVGRPGREIIKKYLRDLRVDERIDFVYANYENSSGGFGLSSKNSNELLSYGIDVMGGGNHSWDKKDIIELLKNPHILRPHNYPSEVAGSGVGIYSVGDERVAFLNLMGHFTMPYVDNMFRCAKESVQKLQDDGIKNIIIDIHAEATSEKRALFMMLQESVTAIIGTHTHVGCDDFQIVGGSAYLSDIGLTGCRDNVIGMDSNEPIDRFMTGISGRFKVPEKCKSIMQIAIMDIADGNCSSAYKLKVFDNGKIIKTDAWIED